MDSNAQHTEIQERPTGGGALNVRRVCVGVIRDPEECGAGKGAQVTKSLISHYEIWHGRRRKVFFLVLLYWWCVCMCVCVRARPEHQSLIASCADLLSAGCMYVFVRANLYPFLLVYCQLLSTFPCTPEHARGRLFLLRFLFVGRDKMCVCARVCVFGTKYNANDAFF